MSDPSPVIDPAPSALFLPGLAGGTGGAILAAACGAGWPLCLLAYALSGAACVALAACILLLTAIPPVPRGARPLNRMRLE